MTKLNTALKTNLDTAILGRAVDELASVVDHVNKLHGAIYRSVLTVTYLAAKRTCDDIKRAREGSQFGGKGKGDTATAAFSRTFAEFRLTYVERGNVWFRDSEDSDTFKAILNSRKDKRVEAARRYLSKKDGFVPADGSDRKAVEGPSKVSSFSRKVFEHAVTNEMDRVATIMSGSDATLRLNAWADFVRDTYGASLRAIADYFATPQKTEAEKFAAFLESFEKRTFSLDELRTLAEVLDRRISDVMEGAKAAEVFAGLGEGEGEGEGEAELAEAA
jgi:hypothetical protein